MSAIDETKTFIPLNIAVLTISDTRSLADDKSGATLADRLDIVGNDLARGQVVTGRGQPVSQRGARLVVGQQARVRDRQYRDVQRHELF